MTWSNVVATGQGRVEFRLVIAGHPIEFVTSTSLEGSSTDGRVRLARLNRSSIKWGESLDPAKVELSQSGFTAEFTDDPDHTVGDAFNREPQKITYLSTTMGVASATASVLSDEFVNGDTIYIGRECFNLTSKVGTTYTVDRSGSSTLATLYSLGYRDSDVTEHPVNVTVGLTRPEMASARVSFEGITVYLFAYGNGETGDGTLVWTGIIEAEPRLRGLTTWELSIGGVSTILDQNLGGGLEETVTPRGINYSDESLPKIIIQRRSGAACTSSLVATDIAEFTPTKQFYETNTALCTDINTKITTLTAGWAVPLDGAAGRGRLFAEVSAEGFWLFRYQTGTTAYWLDVSVTGLIDPFMRSIGSLFSRTANITAFYDAGGAIVDTLAVSTSYFPAHSTLHGAEVAPYALPSAGTVPRGQVGNPPGSRGRLIPTEFLKTIYVGGTTTFLAGDEIEISWPDRPGYDGEVAATYKYEVTAFDATNRIITILDPSTAPFSTVIPGDSWRRFDGATIPTIKSSRLYVANGNVAAFISDIVSNSAVEAPSARQPYVAASHVNTTLTSSEVNPLTSGIPWINNRYYGSRSTVSLKDYITEECKMCCAVPTIGTDGRWSLSKFRYGAVTSTPSYSVDENNYLSEQGIVSYERNAFGSINIIKLKTGYSLAEDEYKGGDKVVNDAVALSRNALPRVMTIEPKSIIPPRPITTSLVEDLYIDDINALGQRWFAVLGAPYDTIKVVCPLTAFPAIIGSYVNIKIKQIPNTSRGGRGIQDRIGIVVGREVNPTMGTITLTAISSVESIYGYTPSSNIDTVTLVSGTQYDIQLVDLGLPGWAMANGWVVGDQVRIETTGPSFGVSVGALISVNTTTNIVRFDWFGGTIPSGLDLTNSPTLEYDAAASAATASMQRYSYIAGTDNRIGFTPTTVNARKLS